MPRAFTPLRAIRPAGEGDPEPMIPFKNEQDPAEFQLQASFPMSNETACQPLLPEVSYEFTPEHMLHLNDGNMTLPTWPSEIQNMGDTTWLLPPCSDQSSNLALILRTEFQSHNITREMLHGTEQRRLEMAQRCKQLENDVQSWAAAYTNLTAALGHCTEAYTRLSTENVELKTKSQIARVGMCVSVVRVHTNQLQTLHLGLSAQDDKRSDMIHNDIVHQQHDEALILEDSRCRSEPTGQRYNDAS
jgi:hypothetical protein